MSIIIETCPKCGHDLQDLVITTYPPIPAKQCFNCGWHWEGKREEIVRVPFNNDTIRNDIINAFNNCGEVQAVLAKDIQNALKKINEIKD